MNKNGKASVLEVTAIGNFYQKKKRLMKDVRFSEMIF